MSLTVPEFLKPYSDGYEDFESGGTPVTAAILNGNYDAYLLALNTFLEALNTSVEGKVDAETGKGLSEENYTSTEKDKLAGIDANATEVVANPTGTSSTNLTKIKIGSSIYMIPSGGSGGSTVEWEQIQLTGTKIATITIDNVPIDVYVPSSGGSGDEVSWTQVLGTGTKIGTITINGDPTDVYAPAPIDVVANPSESATAGDLTKLKVGSSIYSIPSGGSGGASNLSDLSDVTITNVQNGQIIKWNSTTSKWENVTSQLNDLSDVNVSSPSDGQVLKYDSTSNKFVNANESGGGTTVVANPSGTATADLNTIQIGNVIYDVVGSGGGSGSGYTATLIYDGSSASSLQSSIELTEDYDKFDALYFLVKFSNGTSAFGGIVPKEHVNYALTNSKIIGLCAFASVYIGANIDPDKKTFKNIYGGTGTQNIISVYGLKYGSGGENVIGKKDILWEYSNSYDITLAHPFTNYDFLIFEGNNYTDSNHKGGAIVSSTELNNIKGVSGKLYAFAGVTADGFANYVVASDTSITYDSGGNNVRVLRVWGIKLGGVYKEVTGTLTAGATSITLSDSAITTSSTFEPFTSIFGVNPTNMVASTGSVTLTFEAQSSDMDVKVRVS